MTPFTADAWSYYGDRSAEERVRRVLLHYDVDYWTIGGTVRTIVRDTEVIEWIERAVDGYDAVVDEVSETENWVRLRVRFE